MKFTHDIPTKPGYYWWTNFGEHTPAIVEVTKEGGNLYAGNEEFSFQVKKNNMKKIIAACKKYEMEPIDGHWHGEHMWCPIEMPTMDGEVIEPSCY